MKIYKIVTFFIAISIATCIQAQYFTEDFSSATGWGSSGSWGGGGSDILVDLSIGKLVFDNAWSGNDYRLYKQVPPKPTWRAEFELEVKSVSTVSHYGGFVFALMNTQDHFYFPFPSGYNTGIYAFIQADLNGTQNYVELRLSSMETPGLNPFGMGEISASIAINKGQKYYVRIEREDDINITMAIYTDPLFTNSIGQVCTVVDQNINDLDYLMYAVSTEASCNDGVPANINNCQPATHRTLNAEVDNLKMYETNVLSCSSNCSIGANIAATITSNCQYEFTNTSIINSQTTNYIGSVIDFGDGRYEEVDQGNSTLHSYASAGNYIPCIKSFSYEFDGTNYVCCISDLCLSPISTSSSCSISDGSTLKIEGSCDLTADFDLTGDCSGEITLTDNSVVGNGSKHLSTIIDFGDGSDPIETNSNGTYSHEYATSGTYTICMTVFGYFINANGEIECCQDEYCEDVNIDMLCCSPSAKPTILTVQAASPYPNYEFSWNSSIPGPYEIEIRYNHHSCSTWGCFGSSYTKTITGIMTNSYTFIPEKPCFSWRVKSRCNGSYDNWSAYECDAVHLPFPPPPLRKKGLVNKDIGVKETNEESILIIPNPSSGLFTISTGHDQFQYKVVDVNGKLIIDQTQAINNTVSLNLSGQADGIYFVQIITESDIEEFKIIKQQ